MQYVTWTGVWVEVMYSNHKWKQITEPCHSDPTVGYLGRTWTFYKNFTGLDSSKMEILYVH